MGAATLAEANTELRNTLTRLFIDFAEEAESFDAFKAHVELFFNETDRESEKSWNDAVASVRAGVVPGPEGLPILKADSERIVKVTQKPVETVTPKDNMIVRQELDSALELAA